MAAAPDLTPKPVGESQTTMTELMMPSMANNRGNVFGGVILSLVDKAGGVSAARHAGGPCVTVSVDRIDFREPIHLGELVTAKASVNFVGKTSMEVGVRVEAEDVPSGKRRHTNSCYLTFVAIDEKGRPREVPPIVAQSDEEQRRHAAAKTRRALRRQADGG
jgi:acyl-CoA hydrolase